MLKIISPSSFLTKSIINSAIKRFFLSKAYKCDEAWSNRLKNPVFAKINPAIMYHDLDIVFEKKKKVSVLDVDLMLNIVDDSSFTNEMEDVLLRIRQCPESSILPERATHAAIRWFMDKAPKEDLLNVLSDRMNYGLFPDYYLINLLMDKYLTENDASSAVKIAVLQMLQEDFDHPITNILALHSCYNYLDSPEIWKSYHQTDPEPDPSEEPIKVRVRFLRNPYFDDHFDITNTNHLVGKTLWLGGHSLGGTLGLSSQLVGLVLYEKYEKCVELLESVYSSKAKLHEEAVEKAKEYALKKPKQDEKTEEAGAEAAPAVAAEETKSENTNSYDQHKNQVLSMLETFDESLLEKGSLLSISRDMVIKAIAENEEKDIQQQCDMYKKWEKDREENIQAEIEKVNRLKAKEEIKKIKNELAEEEQKLFFFDNEGKIELKVAQNKERQKSIRYYKPKGKEKAKAAAEYIPPTVKGK